MYLTSMFTSQTDTTILDTLHKEEDWILEHIMDHSFINIPPIHIGGFTLDLSITNKVFMMMISAVLLIISLSYAAMKNKKNRVPKGFGNFIEILIVFIRNDIVIPSIGPVGANYMPFFATIFFFILTCNLLGLIPFMSTATGNVSITAGLALITFMMTQALGIRNKGFIGYFKGLVPHGIPSFVLPIMVIVEFLGLLTKPFALCIRLFANMTAGHVVILALIGLIFSLGYAATPVSIIFSLFIYILEILVALLQAYIFTMLSALFIGMAISHEH